MAKILVTIERGGESTTTECDEGCNIQALIEDGHLRGVAVANTRVNGAPAEVNTPVRDGDTVSQVPKSGRQG